MDWGRAGRDGYWNGTLVAGDYDREGSTHRGLPLGRNPICPGFYSGKRGLGGRPGWERQGDSAYWLSYCGAVYFPRGGTTRALIYFSYRVGPGAESNIPRPAL